MAGSLDELNDAIQNDDFSSLPVEPLFADAVSVNKCGRGEWTAKTLVDAKQMACDFAEGVA